MYLKKILKYLVLALFVLNAPTAALNIIGGVAGSITSYSSFILLIVFYFIYSKGKPSTGLALCGILYFTFSAFEIVGDERALLINFSKFLILVIFGGSFFKNVSKKEMAFFLLIGAMSIILNSFLFETYRGRSGGFYFNPNSAGFVAMFGYALAFGLKNKRYKTLLQIVFSLAGFLTFSRTFILIWIIVNLFSVLINKKNIKILALGIFIFLSLLTLGSALNIGGTRFEKYSGVLSNETTSSDLSHDSRTETWSKFYDDVLENPIFGGGYGKFQEGGLYSHMGSHNTYLLIIGESGIIPLLFFLIFFITLYKKSINHFKAEPSLFLMCFVLTAYLLTTHNYYDNEVKVALSLYIIHQIYKFDNLKKLNLYQRKPNSRISI